MEFLGPHAGGRSRRRPPCVCQQEHAAGLPRPLAEPPPPLQSPALPGSRATSSPVSSATNPRPPGRPRIPRMCPFCGRPPSPAPTTLCQPPYAGRPRLRYSGRVSLCRPPARPCACHHARCPMPRAPVLLASTNPYAPAPARRSSLGAPCVVQQSRPAMVFILRAGEPARGRCPCS
jgi:hypothetical protein